MRSDYPALRTEQCLVPKQVRSLDLLDGTTKSPPEFPHKSRRTLMSPQECEIDQCSPNQLEMMTNSPALASEQCPIPHHTEQLDWLPLGNSRDSLRHQSQVYRNTNFSTGTRGKTPCTPYHLEKRADTQNSIKEVGHLPTGTSRGASPLHRYVRGTLNLLPHVQWILKLPDSKESRISL